MFTGIVTELGRIITAADSGDGVELRIEAPETVVDVSVGDSIAVDGVCLTVTSVGDDSFTCFAVHETLERSSLGALRAGSRVNLESAMSSGGRFDGHIVQGHVDGVGTIIGVESEGQSRRMRVAFPQPLAPYVVEKGSVTLSGVSLTITATSPVTDDEGWLEVVLIPHTLAVTTFGGFGPGAMLNIEVDVIAKYVERMMGLKQ